MGRRRWIASAGDITASFSYEDAVEMTSSQWQHTGKRPRYLLPERAPKPIPEHEPEPTYNPQGEWVCHRCGELVKVSGSVPVHEPDLTSDPVADLRLAAQRVYDRLEKYSGGHPMQDDIEAIGRALDRLLQASPESQA